MGKALADGSKAVAIFNKGEPQNPLTIQFKQLGLPESVTARDLWAHQDLGKLNGSFTTTVPVHGVVMLRVR